MSANPPRILIFARTGSTRWWEHVARHLTFASRCTIERELARGPSFAASYRREARRPGAADAALRHFGENGCRELIQRCRCLRRQEPAVARRMIGAALLAWQETLDREQPQLFLSFRVDYFVLDVVERLLTARHIPYVSATFSPFNGLVQFTARGRPIQIRNPAADEVERRLAELNRPEYLAPAVSREKRYSRREVARQVFYYWLRDVAVTLDGWRRGDRLSYRHLYQHRHFGPTRFRWQNYAVRDRFAADWRERSAAFPPEKRVFVALQVNPESTIDYYVDELELIDYQAVAGRLVRTLSAAGYFVLIKDHPNMFGRRRPDFFDPLLAQPNTCLVPTWESSVQLIDYCHTTFTWTGTIGLQAALKGRCSIVVQPIYYTADRFLKINRLADIDALPARIAAWRPPAQLDAANRALVAHLLRACAPGHYGHLAFDPREPAKVHRLAPLLQSLNTYLPRILAGRAVQEDLPAVSLP
ncbi:MAG TPA: hypothetical protein VEB66_08905 [Opitutaceae bacterium]|nr:hypothetical protein [Opitutaceae bacterium]